MINKQLINLSSPASSGGGTGNQEEGLILHLDANDVDSYDGDGTEWVDITNHEYTPATNVSEHFNTVLYDGQATDKAVTGVGFASDLVWIKCRDVTNSHVLADSVRGSDGTRMYSIFSDLVNAQSTSNLIETIDPDGFTVFGDRSATNRLNQEYVAWCFKAGGAPSGSDKVSIDGTSYADEAAAGLTAGTLPVSGLSVNTDLGFSIAKVVDHNNTKTISHGLGTPPELIITKTLDSSDYNWYVYHKDVGNNKYLNLNTTGAASTGTFWNNSSPTSQIFTHLFSSVSHDMIYYCFASKRGVSKVGSYTGTGVSGNKVYTGFEPAFIMIKNTNGTGNWIIVDNKRDPDNPVQNKLAANLNVAENDSETLGTSSVHNLNFNADGFTLLDTSGGLNTNKSGNTYIYYAVAKNTNETSLTPDKDNFTAGSIETTNLELDLDANDYSGSGNWLDGTSNNNDGTITGATYVNDGSSDYFNFDGLNDEVEIPMSFSGGGSIEMWINITDINANNAIASKYTTGTDNRSFAWYVYQTGGVGKAVFSIYYNSSGNGNAVEFDMQDYFTSGKWHHIMHTFDASNRPTIYVDGEAISELSQYNSPSQNVVYSRPSVPVVLGQFDGSTNDTSDFDGKIGQFRIYSSRLTPTQIKSNYDATKVYALPSLELHLDAASFPQYGEAGYSNTPSTWTDSSGNGNNGTISGATFDSELGNWLDFDGTSSNKVAIPDIINSHSTTITGWVRGSGIWFTPQNEIYAPLRTDATYTFYWGNSDTRQDVSGLNDGNWHHMAVSVTSSNTVSYYVDGQHIATKVSSAAFAQNYNFSSNWIGHFYHPSTPQSFNGQIGQVMIYGVGLTADQIRQNYNFTKNNYPNGFNADFVGLSSSDWNPDGYFSTNSGKYFNLGGDTALNFSTNKTISVWVNPAGSSGNRGIIGRFNNVSPYGWILSQSGGNAAFNFYDSSGNGSGTSTATIPINTWTHLSVTYDGSTLIFYKNGSQVSTTSTTAVPSTPSANTLIGRFYSNVNVVTYDFIGKISDVKILDKALTSAEVEAEFNKGQFGEN